MTNLKFLVAFCITLFATIDVYSQEQANKGVFYWGFTMQIPTVQGTITYPFRDMNYANSEPSTIITEDFKESKPLFGASFWYNQPIFRLSDDFSIGATGDFTPTISATGNFPLQGSLSAFLTARYGLGDRKNSDKKFGAGIGIGPQFTGVILYGEDFSYPSTNTISEYGAASGGFPMYSAVYLKPALLIDVYIGRATLKFNYLIGKFNDPKAEGEVPNENWSNIGFTFRYGFN